MPVNNKIQVRRGIYSEWDAQATGILASGEPGYISDFNKLKVGDGSTEWSDLTAVNDNITTIVINKTANTIPKMSVVYINGAQGDLPTIALSIASGEVTSSKTYGLTATDIAPDAIGLVVVDGALKKLNTLTQFSGVSLGTVLYLSPSVSGGITTTKPLSPNHLVSIGHLVRIHGQQGVIQVKIQNGYELGELHNVNTNGSGDNGKFLQYNSTSGVWLASSSGNFSSLTINNNTIVIGTGVANHVAYWNSSSGIVADSGQLYWDSANNRLGIGTSSPSGSLDINGSVYTRGDTNIVVNVSDYADPASSLSHRWFNTYNDANVDIAAIGLGTDDSPSNGELAFFTNNGAGLTEKLRLKDDGNFGIGTSSPSAKLDVNGSANITNNLYAKDKLTVGYDINLNAANSGILFNVAANDSQDLITVNKGSNFPNHYIYLNAITSFNTPGFISTPLVIHPTGYGGSGAVTQGFWRGSTIEVDKGGTGRTSYSNGQLLIGSGTSLVANTLTSTSGIGITNGSGTITIGVTGIPSSTITNFNSSVSGLLPTISNSGDNRVLTSTGSTVGITAESNLTFDGNLLNVTGSGSFSSTVTSSGFVRNAVGVSANDVLLAGGSSAPQGGLSVGSASTANAATNLNGGLAGSIPYQSNTSATTFVSIGSNGQFLTSNGSAPVWTSNPVTGTGVANHIAYWNSSSGIVADSGQLYWDSTNNRLGIGTNSPTTSIHTTGNIRGSGLIINGLDLTSGGQSPSIDLRGYAWFGKSDGSVGIGVNHNNSGTFDSASNFYSFQGLNATVTSYNPICFTTLYAPQLYLNTDGNVGIGTANPESNLHVTTNFSCGTNPQAGDAGMYVDGYTGSVTITDNGPQAIAVIDANGGLTLYGNGGAGGTEILSTDRTNLRIGIGTITPSSTLHVVGDTNIDGNLTFDSFTESVVSNGNSGTSKTLSLASGTVHTCTLTGNCTFTMPTATAGKSFTMFLNTGSGNYTASFSGVRWADSAIPTATILASKVDIYSFISDGSYWYGSFSQNYG